MKIILSAFAATVLLSSFASAQTIPGQEKTGSEVGGCPRYTIQDGGRTKQLCDDGTLSGVFIKATEGGDSAAASDSEAGGEGGAGGAAE